MYIRMLFRGSSGPEFGHRKYVKLEAQGPSRDTHAHKHAGSHLSSLTNPKVKALPDSLNPEPNAKV